VIITAVEQDEINKKLSDKGVGAILRKPFSYKELKETISRLV
jgi:hypothetical protein